MACSAADTPCAQGGVWGGAAHTGGAGGDGPTHTNSDVMSSPIAAGDRRRGGSPYGTTLTHSNCEEDTGRAQVVSPCSGGREGKIHTHMLTNRRAHTPTHTHT